MQETDMIAFGPVPSRRLGQSLGVNNIPPKTCSYSCVYCQIGKTTRMRMEREAFYDVEKIFRDVETAVRKTRQMGYAIDYLAFVPDGEPTLDINLGREIEALRPLGIKIAVITNSSLIDRKDVRQELSLADWVSVKVDAVTESIWKMVDRPHGRISREKTLEGIRMFSEEFTGELVTETMMVRGINDSREEIEKISGFISSLGASKSYISIPIRPPAESGVLAPVEESINMAYQCFASKDISTECLVGYEGNAFGGVSDAAEDLLRIISVHPMREDALTEFLENHGSTWQVVDDLVSGGAVTCCEYGGKKFFTRTITPRRS